MDGDVIFIRTDLCKTTGKPNEIIEIAVEDLKTVLATLRCVNLYLIKSRDALAAMLVGHEDFKTLNRYPVLQATSLPFDNVISRV